jgi:hypothetical protein
MSLQGWIVAVAVLAYAAFALLPRRPVGLWLSTLGRLALILAALRLVMTLCGYEMEGLWEWLAWGATLAAGAGLSLCRRLAVVRATPDKLSEQVRWACQGLFLACTEDARGFLLSHKQGTPRLGRVSLSGHWQLLVLPKPGGSAKVALLVDWLGKQYPGPFPRIRIVLRRE